MPEAKRTLVKSGPELWAEVSDPEALAGHLAPFGEIRITRTADDSLVEWEGERVTGRLELEPSGFGTRVVLQAELVAPEPVAPPPEPPRAPEPPPAPAPAPVYHAPAPPPAKQGFLARLLRRQVPAPAPAAPAPPPRPVAVEPVAPPPPAPPPAPAVEPWMPEEEVVEVLTGLLDHLGTAHHRPFSRG